MRHRFGTGSLVSVNNLPMVSKRKEDLELVKKCI